MGITFMKLKKNSSKLFFLIAIVFTSALIALAPIGPSEEVHADSTPTTSQCTIGALGWILCPVLNTMGSMADDMLGIFQGFLRIDAPKTLGVDTVTYKVWQSILSIANVVFVIIFLIVIFSQITNIGISNYGIKKILPKLIIAAILVNLSFYICQIAVDLSNIVGNSIQGLLDNATSGVTGSTGGWWSGNNTFTNILGGTTGILVAASVAWASLATIIPALVGAIIALLMILFILVGRQALIILLTVAAPLAIAAMVLPNTETLFKKWQKTFMAMLLLYPIVTSVFGISKLASSILGQIFTDSHDTIGQIMAGAITIIPLFVVPGLLKSSLSSLGKLGGTLSSLGDKWSGSAKSATANTRALKHYQENQDRKNALIQSGQYDSKFGKFNVRGRNFNVNPNNWRSGIHKGINESKFSGVYGDKEAARGVVLEKKINDEQVSNNEILMQDYTRDQLRNFAYDDKTPTAKRQAAIKKLVAANDVEGIGEMWNKVRVMDNSKDSKFLRNTFADALMSSGSRPAYLGGGAIAAMRSHSIDPATGNYAQLSHDETVTAGINTGVYSREKMATADPDELKNVIRLMDGATAEAKSRLIEGARAIKTDPILSSRTAKNEPQINEIANRAQIDNNNTNGGGI
jgi:hypothetical protein